MDEPEVKLTGFQNAIKILTEAHFVRLPSNLNIYPNPGTFITKVTPENFGVLVGLIDRYVGYYFDSNGELLERVEIEREKSIEEKNIPEATIEVFPHGEVWEARPEEGEELADEG
jgi:hypothetical protein